jgi:hypothetical protein
LTCVSFVLHHTFQIHIDNQCSDFELVSPVYFGHNTIWIRSPDQKVDANAITRASFGQDIANDHFVVVLIYKLQRKRNLESNTDNTSKEESQTNFQLLIICEPEIQYEFPARALLIEHSNAITWDEYQLKMLHSMRYVLLEKCYPTKNNDVTRKYSSIEYMWLLDDTTALMTTSKLQNDNYVFEIIPYDVVKKIIP